jgi:hypothetical protein
MDYMPMDYMPMDYMPMDLGGKPFIRHRCRAQGLDYHAPYSRLASDWPAAPRPKSRP